MANITINDETVATSAAAADTILFWDVANGYQRKITKANFMGGVLTGGGTIATGGFTLTVPATGTAALRNVAQTFTAAQTFGTVHLGSPEAGVTESLSIGGNDSDTSSVGMSRYSADANGPAMRIRKSRNASVGGHTVVQNNDSLGIIAFLGSDGTNFESAVWIQALVDGTPGNNDMPGRLSVLTTPDGAVVPEIAFTIGQDKRIVAPYIWSTAVNGTAVQINSNGILTKATSSRRYKRNIRPLGNQFGNEFLASLNPVLYKDKGRFVDNGDSRPEFRDYEDSEDSPDYVGLIAEDVYALGGTPFISLDDEGKPETLHYDRLVSVLIAGWQEHEARISELEKTIAGLMAKRN